MKKYIFLILFFILFLGSPLPSFARLILPEGGEPYEPPPPPTGNYIECPEFFSYEDCTSLGGWTKASGSFTTTDLDICAAKNNSDPNTGNVCCAQESGCSSPCGNVPIWAFCYAKSCEITSLGPDFGFSATVVYQYNQCNTEDRCFGATTGASGFDGAGRIIPGICSASSFNGTDPNTACISGGHYKQCCTNPSPGYTPATACSSGVCPSGFKTSAGDTTCDNPIATPAPGPKYKCSGTACVRDDAAGGFTTSNCDNKCGTCETAPTYSPPKNTPTFVPGSCNPTATSCTAPCSDTCNIAGQTCAATSCVSVWGCQNGTTWYNDGRYYSTCPASCGATPAPSPIICVPGQKGAVTCDTANACVPK